MPLPSRLPVVLAALCLLHSAAAHAVFVDREMDSLDTEALYDSEYFLYPRSFDFALEWPDAFEYATGPAYWIAGESRDGYLRQALRVPLEFKDWFIVEYEYATTHSNNRLPRKETETGIQQVDQGLALGILPIEHLEIFLRGDPNFDNRNDYLALETRYNDKDWGGLWGTVEVRDVYFNGAAAGRYDRHPVSFIAGGLYHRNNESVMYEVRMDLPLIRNMPQENRQYQFRRTRTMIDWRHRAVYKGAWDVRAGYHYDFKRESDVYSLDPRGATQDFRRAVHTVEASAFRWIKNVYLFEAGTTYLIRTGKTDFANRPELDVRHTRWELQPHTRFRYAIRHWAVSEVGLFFSVGERRRAYDLAGVGSVADDIVETKLGLGQDVMVGNHAMFGIYTTYDLDTPKHFWDGGHFRLMLLF